MQQLAEILASKKPLTGGGQKLRASAQFKKVSAMYLHPANSRSLVGSMVESERFGCARSSFATGKLTLMGALAYFCNRSHIVSALLGLLGSLLNGDELPHLLVILLASDATPLPVGHAQNRRTQSEPAKPAAAQSSGETAIVVREMVARGADFRSTSRKHSKILQSEVEYVVTTRIPAKDPELEDGTFTTYDFFAFCNLQHLDKAPERTPAKLGSTYYICLVFVFSATSSSARVWLRK